MSGFNLNDYVDVAARIRSFYERFPDGSLRDEIVELSDHLVVMRGYAYRTADDASPAIAHSQLAIPGSTPYTRGSEIENAGTSAIGRAIAYLGFDVKKGIASREEVRNKSDQSSAAPRPAASSPAGASAPEDVYEGRVDKGRAPVDQSLRQTPDGPVFGFVLLEDIPGSKYPRKTQVVCVDGLADATSTAFTGMGVPATAMVWGRVEMVPWQKDGQDMKPFRRVHATRIKTAEWTLPAEGTTEPASVAPSGAGEPVEDLSDLPW